MRKDEIRGNIDLIRLGRRTKVADGLCVGIPRKKAASKKANGQKERDAPNAHFRGEKSPKKKGTSLAAIAQRGGIRGR